MAKLTAEQRKNLSARVFAGTGATFPIPDLEHARLALQMSGRKSPAEQAKIKAAVYAKYPQLKPKPAM